MTAKGSPWGSRQPAGRAILRSGTSGTRVPGRARGMHAHTSCPPWPRGTHVLGQAEQARIHCPLGKDSVPTQQHLAFESNCRSGPWVPSSFAVARSCDLRLRLPTQAEVPQPNGSHQKGRQVRRSGSREGADEVHGRPQPLPRGCSRAILQWQPLDLEVQPTVQQSMQQFPQPNESHQKGRQVRRSGSQEGAHEVHGRPRPLPRGCSRAILQWQPLDLEVQPNRKPGASQGAVGLRCERV
jgi:hypothetical protein